jgi:arylsulfatase A-like enzyme/cytochrome c-type biogenesis protein CcmH/NrfG
MGRRSTAILLGALALTLGACALSLVACGKGDRGASPGAPVILISIDTLRSDRVGAFGAAEVRTPKLDALARESILFERAYSHYPITLPSHASVFTGLLPPDHGVRDNVGYPFDAKAHPYLPTILKQAGYRNGAAVSAFVLNGETGLEKDFDFFEDSIEARRDTPLGGLQRPGQETLSLALRWLDQQAPSNQRVFLFTHVYEPHTPYTPPEPYASQYRHPYDGEVAYVDAVVGEFLDGLKQRQVYDDALIVVFSDHGEGLGDHGEEEHGLLLYREALQVPLLVKLPGGARGGERVAEPAQLVDILPTVLEVVGLPIPQGLRGSSLLGLDGQGAQRSIYAETFYPRLHMGWNELASLISGPHQYIEAPRPELYDLLADPAQKTNILERERRVFATLRDEIQPLRKPLSAPAAVDAETQARLAALGYTGAPVLAGDGPLPDPKDQIGTLGDLREATRLMGAKRFNEAVPLLERMLVANPRMQDGWDKLALALTKAGRRQEAVEVYQKALENSGGSALVALTLASLLADLGRLPEARAHAELALATSPAKAHGSLAEIALIAKDLPEAEKQARQALAADSNRLQSWLTLALVLARQERLTEARQAFTEMEKRQQSKGGEPPIAFYLVRGDLEARERRFPEAIASFREEIGRNPDLLDSFSRLAFVLAASGQAEAAIATLRQMVDANERSPAAYAVAVEALRALGLPQDASRLLAFARTSYPGDPRLAQLGASS